MDRGGGRAKDTIQFDHSSIHQDIQSKGARISETLRCKDMIKRKADDSVDGISPYAEMMPKPNTVYCLNP